MQYQYQKQQGDRQVNELISFVRSRKATKIEMLINLFNELNREIDYIENGESENQRNALARIKPELDNVLNKVKLTNMRNSFKKLNAVQLTYLFVNANIALMNTTNILGYVDE